VPTYLDAWPSAGLAVGAVRYGRLKRFLEGDANVDSPKPVTPDTVRIAQSPRRSPRLRSCSCGSRAWSTSTTRPATTSGRSVSPRPSGGPAGHYPTPADAHGGNRLLATAVGPASPGIGSDDVVGQTVQPLTGRGSPRRAGRRPWPQRSVTTNEGRCKKQRCGHRGNDVRRPHGEGSRPAQGSRRAPMSKSSATDTRSCSCTTG
jgi:hypothetical protein